METDLRLAAERQKQELETQHARVMQNLARAQAAVRELTLEAVRIEGGILCLDALLGENPPPDAAGTTDNEGDGNAAHTQANGKSERQAGQAGEKATGRGKASV